MNTVKYALVMIAGMVIQAIGNEVKETRLEVSEYVQPPYLIFVNYNVSTCKDNMSLLATHLGDERHLWIF